MRLALIALTIAGISSSAIAGDGTPLSIPAGSLQDSLAALAHDTGLSIGFGDVSLKGYESRPVYRAPTARQALDRILAKSPFTYKFVDEDTVLIVERAEDDSLVDGDHSAPMRAGARDTIYVTATKRTAAVKDIPGTISSLNGEYIARLGIRDISELSSSVAGLSATNLGVSRNKVFIRGISDGAFADRTQSTVGVYLDETPLIFNDTNPDLRIVDVDRVEVLRGPQGALYGAGYLGGVYRMVTAKPDLENYSARAQMNLSGTRNGGVDGAADLVVNIPIDQDNTALRASAYYERSSGYIDNIRLGENNTNETRTAGGRIAVRRILSRDWSIDISATGQFVKLEDAQYTTPALGGLRRSNANREPYLDDFRVVSATLSGDTQLGAVTSTSSYILRDSDTVFDATDALPLLIGDASATGVENLDSNIRSFSHETRIASESGRPFQWVIGANFLSRHENLLTSLRVGSSGATPFESFRHDRIGEIGLFAETTAKLTENLELTSGVRWTRTTFDVDFQSSGVINSRRDKNLVDRRTLMSVSPKIALSYRASPNANIYALFSRGSRIGGFNVSTPLAALTIQDPGDDTSAFESDSLWNIETGIKAAFADGLITANLSAFYVRWNDIQTDQILPNGFSYIANAGRARNRGVEAELTTNPFDGLEASLSLFWNDPELLEANPFLGAKRGDALPNIPEISAGFSVAYDFPISGPWRGVADATFSYVGKSYLTFAQSDAPTMGEYASANLRIGARRDRLSAGLFAKNITNSRGNTFAFGNPFSISAAQQETPLRPRVIGIFAELTY
ncbi:MAG: TonB-dependent receptor [Parvularculaceae bacterium]